MNTQNIVFHKHRINQKKRSKLLGQKPFVLWFTGLSGAGKSTIASEVELALFQRKIKTYLLDGDNIRHGLNQDLGFSETDRIENIRRVAEVSKLMVDAGLVVLTAFISPFVKDRQMTKNLFKEDEFIEVFVDAPLEVCMRRDKKGLYAKAQKGSIKNFTGIGSPYEYPENPQIHIRTDQYDIQTARNKVLDYLMNHEYIIT